MKKILKHKRLKVTFNLKSLRPKLSSIYHESLFKLDLVIFKAHLSLSNSLSRVIL